MTQSHIVIIMKNDKYMTNLLGAFATTVSTQIEQSVAELGGRSLSHEAALVAIYNHPNNSIDMLSKVLGLTHSGAVRLINTLEKEKLVERHRSNEDARAVVLRVTIKGKARAYSVLQAREKITTQIVKTLTVKQKTALEPVLEAMLGALTNGQEGARRICRMCNEEVCRIQGCPVERATNNALGFEK